MSTQTDYSSPGRKQVDWRAAISDNIAWALLITTVLLIFISMPKMKYAFEGITVYLLLVVMVGAFIPVLRFFEKRWTNLSDSEAQNPSLRGSFRRDQLALWLLTVGVPLLLAAFFGTMFPGK